MDGRRAPTSIAPRSFEEQRRVYREAHRHDDTHERQQRALVELEREVQVVLGAIPVTSQPARDRNTARRLSERLHQATTSLHCDQFGAGTCGATLREIRTRSGTPTSRRGSDAPPALQQSYTPTSGRDPVIPSTGYRRAPSAPAAQQGRRFSTYRPSPTNPHPPTQRTHSGEQPRANGRNNNIRRRTPSRPTTPTAASVRSYGAGWGGPQKAWWEKDKEKDRAGGGRQLHVAGRATAEGSAARATVQQVSAESGGQAERSPLAGRRPNGLPPWKRSGASPSRQKIFVEVHAVTGSTTFEHVNQAESHGARAGTSIPIRAINPHQAYIPHHRKPLLGSSPPCLTTVTSALSAAELSGVPLTHLSDEDIQSPQSTSAFTISTGSASSFTISVSEMDLDSHPSAVFYPGVSMSLDFPMTAQGVGAIHINGITSIPSSDHLMGVESHAIPDMPQISVPVSIEVNHQDIINLNKAEMQSGKSDWTRNNGGQRHQDGAPRHTTPPPRATEWCAEQRKRDHDVAGSSQGVEAEASGRAEGMGEGTRALYQRAALWMRCPQTPHSGVVLPPRVAEVGGVITNPLAGLGRVKWQVSEGLRGRPRSRSAAY